MGTTHAANDAFADILFGTCDVEATLRGFLRQLAADDVDNHTWIAAVRNLAASCRIGRSRPATAFLILKFTGEPPEPRTLVAATDRLRALGDRVGALLGEAN